MKHGDIALISGLLLLAAALFALSVMPERRPAATAVVTADGEVCAELALDEDAVFVVNSHMGTNTVRVSGGKVFVEDASCANQNCVEHRAISRTGEAIVCLPNRVTVTIKAADDGFDSVAY